VSHNRPIQEPVRRLFAALTVVAAACRLTVLERHSRFDLYVERLRRGRPLPRHLRDPVLLGRAVRRLAHRLPPMGMGRCLKRSLLLLHLWSRCGLDPVLHIGVHSDGDRRRAHAWLTCDRPELAAYCGHPAGTTETVSFAAGGRPASP